MLRCARVSKSKQTDDGREIFNTVNVLFCLKSCPKLRKVVCLFLQKINHYENISNPCSYLSVRSFWPDPSQLPSNKHAFLCVIKISLIYL